MSQQAAQNQLAIGGQGLKRVGGGMNLQPEGDKTRSRNNGVAATTRVSSRKPTKNYKQNCGGKREQTFSKNSKKLQHADPKNWRKSQSNARLGTRESTAAQSLLNFHYSPIRGESTSWGGPIYRRKRTSTFNKEVFLQANCHFVVDDDAERYVINAADPDVIVDWDAIQLVYLPTHDASTCPICLYPPTAAKMTRCGHVYCWSCILHYLKLGDKSWRKCPICHEAVHGKDLKSVILSLRKKFARFDTISMKLMRRAKDSLFAYPNLEWECSMTQLFPTWEDRVLNSASKLMLASPQSILESILLREKNELEIQLSESILDESEEESFIRSALQILQNKIEAATGTASIVQNSALEEDQLSAPASANIYGEDKSLATMLAHVGIQENDSGATAFTDDESEDSELSVSPSIVEEGEQKEPIDTDPSIEIEQEEFVSSRKRVSESFDSDLGDFAGSPNESLKDAHSYYFYQSDDGQNIFIHSLNARCLMEEYGALDAGPSKITGQIIDFECFTMTKELRRRFRYLGHLPLSCEFVICELMLRPPVLSKHTIHNFMSEFKKRKAMRLKKIEEQRKFDQRASAVRHKQEGYRVPSEDMIDINIDLTDMTDFPCSFTPTDSIDGKVDDGLPRQDVETHFSGPSFAQMLKTEGAVLKKEVEHQPKAVRGDPHLMTRDLPKSNSDNDDDDGADIVAPTFKEMFSAAMFTTPVEQNPEESSAKGKKSGGKRKKNKGLLLFSTGAQRKY